MSSPSPPPSTGPPAFCRTPPAHGSLSTSNPSTQEESNGPHTPARTPTPYPLNLVEPDPVQPATGDQARLPDSTIGSHDDDPSGQPTVDGSTAQAAHLLQSTNGLLMTTTLTPSPRARASLPPPRLGVESANAAGTSQPAKLVIGPSKGPLGPQDPRYKRVELRDLPP